MCDCITDESGKLILSESLIHQRVIILNVLEKNRGGYDGNSMGKALSTRIVMCAD
jgi:hypothetical protein